MLNASNTPVAYKISKEDPYLTPQERNIVNKEIDSWHDLPDDLKGIQLARYIHADQVNLKNARNFTRSSFKLDGEESDTEALLTSNNISLRSEVESLNIDKSVLKSRVTSLENDSMLLRNNLQNTQKKLTKAQKTISEHEQIKLPSYKALKTNKTKMAYLIHLTQINGISVRQEEWQAYEAKNSEKYKEATTKFPAFKFTVIASENTTTSDTNVVTTRTGYQHPQMDTIIQRDHYQERIEQP